MALKCTVRAILPTTKGGIQEQALVQLCVTRMSNQTALYKDLFKLTLMTLALL